MDNRARSPVPNHRDLVRDFAMMLCRRSLLPVFLAVGLATVATSAKPPNRVPSPSPGDPPVETGIGVLGYQPPEVADVRLSDTILHQDTTGGVIQQLLGASGNRGGGFGLVWRDQRDGMLGIYCARLDADGNLREPERSVSSAPGTTRRYDPTIAIGPDGAGIAAWVARHAPGGQRPRLRCFNAEGAWYSADLLVPPTAGGPGQSRSGVAGDSDVRTPVALARRDGSRTLLWIEHGRVRSADFDVAGSPLRPVADFGPAGTEAAAGLFAVEDAAGGVAAVWNGKQGAWLARRGPGSTKSTDVQLGEGRASGLAADPDGGVWSLIQRQDAAVLRHTGADGKAQGPDILRPFAALRGLALAATDGGLALLATCGTAPATKPRGPGRGRDGVAGPGSSALPGSIEPQRGEPQPRGGQREPPAAKPSGPVHLELVLLDARGASAESAPLAVTTAEARDVERAFLASNGTHVLVAWNDTRLGDSDVFARVVDTTAQGGARLGPEKRVNTDYASSDQIYPDVDAVGERGWSVWQDRRAGAGSLFARRFDATGPLGSEIELPVGIGDDAPVNAPGGASEPCVSMRPDGSMLATWTQRDPERARVHGQVLDRDGRPRAPRIEIDSRPPPSLERAATSALSGDRGWIAVWPAGGKLGIFGRRIAPDGTLAGPARRISEPGDDETMHADVTLLDDGRSIAAWTVHEAGAAVDKGWSLRARFLDADGGPKGGELRFEPSRRWQDHDPALAAAVNGGFMLAWCSGIPSDPTHDVNVRLFDAQGRPAGPNVTPCFFANEQDYPDITRLADGSYAVAWEDDVSYYDQSYVRRISADGKSMGPMMRIGTLETLFVLDRVVPRITAFGDGWAAVFADRQRSKGFDARLKIVGRRFDPPGGG
jgi:hypothetical protein